MTTVRISHRTTYQYRQPVLLGPHRLMLRPREGLDLRLVSCDLVVNPPALLTWAEDVFGNAVATARFQTSADRLTVACTSVVRAHAVAWPVFDIAATAISYPFRYSDAEWTNLGSLVVPAHPDPSGAIRAWALDLAVRPRTDTLALLADLNRAVADRVTYEVRDEEGTQSPGVTLDRGRGSCRDMAMLFADAARWLGFGARVVSGYLCDPGLVGGAGSTHAWAETYVPGAGWIAYDPTNRRVGAHGLVPVAVARDIGQAMPVTGSFTGPSDALEEMRVEVDVVPLPDPGGPMPG